jgi:hypothetical protein
MNNAHCMTAWSAALLATAILLGLPGPAGAALKEIERAYEVAPGAIRLPTVSTAPLTLFPCPGCAPVTLRVTPATGWYAAVRAPRPAGQDAVLDALRDAGANRQTLLYVFYDPRTSQVKRIVLDVPATGVAR